MIFQLSLLLHFNFILTQLRQLLWNVFLEVLCCFSDLFMLIVHVCVFKIVVK